MLEAGGSFRLQTEPLEMRLRGPWPADNLSATVR
jgi:hypothetical protein